MRLDGWDIEAFGALEDLKADGLSDHDILVLLGDNEAGKSTFFDFLTTMLFGFRPTSREKHPYNPWSGRPPHGALSLVLSDGERATVTRRLLSSPQGQLASTKGETTLDNRPVPWVGALSRRMYRNVFALTIDEANTFEESTWREVEEQLLGGASFDFIVPAREAIENLGARANDLWRKDRVGKPLAKRLDQQMKSLRDARNDARARLKDTLSLEQRGLDIFRELEQLRAELTEKKVRIRQAAELMPIVGSVREIRRLREAAEAVLFSKEIPREMETILGHAVEEKIRIDREITELTSKIQGLESRSSITEEEERFLGCADEIDGLAQQSGAQVQDRIRQAELQRKTALLTENLEDRAEMVLSSALNDDVADALSGLPMAELRGRIQVWTDARRPVEKAEDERRHAERELEATQAELLNLPEIGGEKALQKRLERLRSLQAQEDFINILEEEKRLDSSGLLQRHGARIISAVLFLGALVMAGALAAGLVVQSLLFGAVALCLALLGFIHEGYRRRAAKGGGERVRALKASSAKLRQELHLDPSTTPEQEIEPIQQQLQASARRNQLINTAHAREKILAQRTAEEQDHQKEQESSRRSILKVLEEIPVVAVRLELPDKDLASELDGIRTALRELHETQQELEEVRRRVGGREEQARQLADRLGFQGDGQPMDHVKSLAQKLREGADARSRAKHIRDQLRDANDLMGVRAEARDELEEKIKNLETLLASIDKDQGDPQTWLSLLQDARSKEAQANTLEQSLVPGWEEKVARFHTLEEAGVRIELSTEELVALESDIDQLEQKQRRLDEEKGTVEQKSANLGELPGVDDVEGEIQALKETQARIRVQRDRLILLRAVIREADNRFRAEHQPTVFRQASRYISAITEGRYSALSVDTTLQATQLVVHHHQDISPQPLQSHISRGTREQIYLALRLAFTDHIGGDLALPLVLDELFVNWDPARTEQGLQLVAEASKNRQILLLTCHPELAHKAEQQVGAKILELPAVPGTGV